jgi:hypothetical protein
MSLPVGRLPTVSVVMVVTKVTAFSTSRQHGRGRLTTVAVVVVVTKVTAFPSILYYYHHQNN